MSSTPSCEAPRDRSGYAFILRSGALHPLLIVLQEFPLDDRDIGHELGRDGVQIGIHFRERRENARPIQHLFFAEEVSRSDHVHGGTIAQEPTASARHEEQTVSLVGLQRAPRGRCVVSMAAAIPRSTGKPIMSPKSQVEWRNHLLSRTRRVVSSNALKRMNER